MDGPLDVHFDPEPSTFGILNPPLSSSRTVQYPQDRRLSPRPNIIHIGYFSEKVPSYDRRRGTFGFRIRKYFIYQ